MEAIRHEVTPSAHRLVNDNEEHAGEWVGYFKPAILSIDGSSFWIVWREKPHEDVAENVVHTLVTRPE